MDNEGWIFKYMAMVPFTFSMAMAGTFLRRVRGERIFWIEHLLDAVVGTAIGVVVGMLASGFVPTSEVLFGVVGLASILGKEAMPLAKSLLAKLLNVDMKGGKND